MTYILRSLKFPCQKQEGPKIISAMNRYAWEMRQMPLTLGVSPQQQKYLSSALIKKKEVHELELSNKKQSVRQLTFLHFLQLKGLVRQYKITQYSDLINSVSLLLT